jgi:peptide/nickel transport system substrate-binding protein
MRKDYANGLTVSENGLNDPDQQFYENFSCGAERNYTGYCNAEVDQLIDRQSSEPDTGKRKQIVWDIERKLAEDAAVRRSSIRNRRLAGSPISRGTR